MQSCKRYQEAIAQFNGVIKLQPKNARAYARRGLAYKSLKQYDRVSARTRRVRRKTRGALGAHACKFACIHAVIESSKAHKRAQPEKHVRMAESAS